MRVVWQHFISHACWEGVISPQVLSDMLLCTCSIKGEYSASTQPTAFHMKLHKIFLLLRGFNCRIKRTQVSAKKEEILLQVISHVNKVSSSHYTASIFHQITAVLEKPCSIKEEMSSIDVAVMPLPQSHDCSAAYFDGVPYVCVCHCASHSHANLHKCLVQMTENVIILHTIA
jgi:hypothetical protein